MNRPFVDKVRIENFGCIHDATFALTPLHAVIGPNDSGKSTALRAIQTAAELTKFGQTELRDSEIPLRGSNSTLITLSVANIHARFSRRSNVWHMDAPGHLAEYRLYTPLGPVGFARPFQGATLLRFDPDDICAPAKPLPEEVAYAISERGGGMSAAYEALLSRDRAAFISIETRVQVLFPSVKSIWLPTTQSSEKQLGVELVDGTRVIGAQMSEGLIYWLAFALLEHIQPNPILLIEEPENGLHPSRIGEVVRVLRKISATTQVILATHSPLVINEMRPEEVTLLTRDPVKGTQATPIAETTAFKSREKVYALGELWLSFADGNTEEKLVPKTGT